MNKRIDQPAILEELEMGIAKGEPSMSYREFLPREQPKEKMIPVQIKLPRALKSAAEQKLKSERNGKGLTWKELLTAFVQSYVASGSQKPAAPAFHPAPSKKKKPAVK